MKEIQLTQGRVALVDDEDYNMLMQYKWCAVKDRNTFYAVTNLKTLTGFKYQTMHRLLINIPRELVTDHLDGNGLNNQKLNLRSVTSRENLQNLHIEKTSKYPGIYWNKKRNNWMAKIVINKQTRYICSSVREEDAAIAYKIACKVLFDIE